MRARDALELHREEIRRIVLARKAENPRVFGSVATGTDDENSDLDLLIDPPGDVASCPSDKWALSWKSYSIIEVDISIARSLRAR